MRFVREGCRGTRRGDENRLFHLNKKLFLKKIKRNNNNNNKLFIWRVVENNSLFTRRGATRCATIMANLHGLMMFYTVLTLILSRYWFKSIILLSDGAPCVGPTGWGVNTPSPPIKSFPMKSPWVKLSGRPPTPICMYTYIMCVYMYICICICIYSNSTDIGIPTP